MAAPAETPSSVRFAEFVLDLRTRELSNKTHRLSLQEQPFQILSALLERPGELVTRDELRNRLWPSDTFVDFEHSLNKAVNRLREALEDSAEHPRFIETLPRRGYRWIAPMLAPLDSHAGSAADTVLHESLSKPANPVRWSHNPIFRAVVVGVALLLGAFLALKVASRKTQGDSSIHSLAVLPLESLSAESTQAYFADGMTDQLITDLGQVNELRVISRTSIMQYKGTRKSLSQIARELNVDAIVEGTVLRSGDQVRITAQLIESSRERHLWAHSYQGDLRDILALQNQVASAIALQIRKKLIQNERAGKTQTRSVNPEAYEAFLNGSSQPSLTTDGAQRRIHYFEQAVRLQPDYAEAYAQIGYSYLRLGHMLALPPQEAFPKAQVAASKVLEIDSLLHDGHIIAANVKFLYEWDFSGAAKEMQRALELNPNSSYAHRAYADFLIAMGRPEEAIAEIGKLGAIDPLELSSSRMAGELYMARRYDEAISQARKVLTQNPNSDEAHLWLGLALEQKHAFADGIEELKKASELSNNRMWIGFVAQAQALAGDRTGALRILRDLQRLSRGTYVSPWWFAVIYAGLGDQDRAFVWLEKAYQEREHDLAFSNAWPIFDNLHSDPRYQDLIRRVGLPPPRASSPGVPSS